MKFENIAVVRVFLMHEAEKFFVGRLAVKNREIFFEYDGDFLKRKIEISPFKLPLQINAIRCEDKLFEGKNPRLSHLLKLAEMSGIKKQRAQLIVDEVRSAVSKWSFHAKYVGVSAASLKMIARELGRVEGAVFYK